MERFDLFVEVPHIYRDRSNPFELYDDAGILYRFRLDQNTVLWLLDQLEGQLDKIQNIFGLHISTISRIVYCCSRALASLYDQFIEFTHGAELQRVQEDFARIARLPGIVGEIECTHIPIMCPNKEQSELFRNRKGYFSINVQAIEDAELLIRNLMVRWPGSAHDSRIFDNSNICARFENNEINGVLLGDNGYPLRAYLITPLLRPQTNPERRFNIAHCRTRVKIENLFVVLKRRFPCLAKMLRLKLD